MIAEYALPFALTLAAGLATALGGLVVFQKRQPSQVFFASALGFSAGVMLWVSFLEIIPKATAYFTESFGAVKAQWYAVAAVFAGIAVIGVIDRLVPDAVNPHEPVLDASNEFDEDRNRAQAFRKMGFMMALAIGIHNFPEGFATFIAGTNDLQIALPIAVAIAVHNIPEGIAVAIPIWQSTGSRASGFKWATITGLAEPIGALVGFALLAPFMGPTTMGICFAMIAGVMVFISIDELLPTAIATGKHHAAIYGLIVGMAVMAMSLLLFL